MMRPCLTLAALFWLVSPVVGYECIPGDGNLDGDVDFHDYAGLQLCFTGAGGVATQDCLQHDFDEDGDVDLDDAAMHFASATDPVEAFDYGESPRNDAEAEQIALETFPFLLATDEHYERLIQNLDAMHDAQPNLAGVVHDPQWIPTEMIVKVTDGVDRCDFDALNAFYQITELEFLFQSGGGTWYVVHFPGRLNIPLLAPEYTALAEVEFVDPNFLIGTDDSIDVTPGGDTWTYDIDDGFHDCFDGCDCHIYWTFEVDADGNATELSMQCIGQPWCEFPPFCEGS